MKKDLARGQVIERGDPAFDEALFGTSFSAEDTGRRPDVIVQANDAAEVVAAIARANRENLRVSTCSGGHSWSQNHIRGRGMLIDLSRLKAIAIDAPNRTAMIGPGCLSGDLNLALVPHGLFFPVAHAYTVGMGGFLLQGGFGWNSRDIGIACQSVTAIDAVLADGRTVHASECEHPELLWAARGGGAGFPGIVTRFHLALHDRPRFTGLKVQVFRMRHLEEVVRWAHAVGPSVSPKVEFQMVFNQKAFGIFAHGIEVISPVLTDSRRAARAATAFIDESPIRRLASFTLPIIPMKPNTVMKAAEKVIFLPGMRWHTDNMWLDGPVEPALPGLRRMADTQPAPPAHALWMNWNPRDAARPDMAFSLEAPTYLALYGGFPGASPRTSADSWATDNARALEPYSRGVQLADENLARRPARFLAPANLARLDAIVERYDPSGRFYSFGHLAAAHAHGTIDAL